MKTTRAIRLSLVWALLIPFGTIYAAKPGGPTKLGPAIPWYADKTWLSGQVKVYAADLNGDGMLDLVVGAGWLSFGNFSLTYMENTGTSTAPVFVQRTGSTNPFDGIDVSEWNSPTFSDIDNDGTLRPRPSIERLRPHFTFLAQATWTS